MNRFQRGIQPAKEAVVEYTQSDFHVVSPGAFVRCAVTGEPIPLEELRYWSSELQEAYSSTEASLKHYREKLLEKRGA